MGNETKPADASGSGASKAVTGVRYLKTGDRPSWQLNDSQHSGQELGQPRTCKNMIPPGTVGSVRVPPKKRPPPSKVTGEPCVHSWFSSGANPILRKTILERLAGLPLPSYTSVLSSFMKLTRPPVPPTVKIATALISLT